MKFYYCDLEFLGRGWIRFIVGTGLLGSLIMFILMYNLASTADEYLSPALEKITLYFKMNESLAGVTLLAFGNGAPDVFSALAASESSSGE